MTDANTDVKKPSDGFWPWLWLILVLIAAVPNGIMIYTAKSLQPDSVSAHPYQDSQRFDQQKKQRHTFDLLGYQLATTCPGDLQVQLQLTGPLPLQGVQVRFRRPADASMDRVVDWADPAEAIAVELPAPGLWQLELTGTAGKQTIATRAVLGDV